MSYSNPLEFNSFSSNLSWECYIPLTLQIWKSFTSLRESLEQGIHSSNPSTLLPQVADLVCLTDSLRIYLPASSNCEKVTATTVDSWQCLLVAENALECLQEGLASDGDPDSLKLWENWHRLQSNLAALRCALKT